MTRLITLFFALFFSFQGFASYILIPMDVDSQAEHLKAYGITYWTLERQLKAKWLLNYRGGSFLLPDTEEIRKDCQIRGVSFEVLSDSQTNQILEDMLRACVISFGMKWEDCLPYAEFSYNNSFQASSGKAPFEILYGRKCRTPLNWSETGERQLVGNDLITEAEEMCKVILSASILE